MKRCPTCQKTFDDSKRFCQIDGTPLVEDKVEPSEQVDPYKTIVGGQFTPPSDKPEVDSMKTMVVDSKSKEEDVLQIPEAFDPMKTVVVSDPIKSENPADSFKEPISQPEPPKFNEPSLSPPSFGDLSASSSEKNVPKIEELPKQQEPPKFESPFPTSTSEPRKEDSPFSASPNEMPKFGSPFSETPNEQPKFEPQFGSSESQETPKENPFPPFKDITSPLGEKKDPFQSSAFGLPQTPLEKSYTPPNQTFNPPPVQQNDWTAPPPVGNWQDQDINANMPFQPPVAGATEQNKTLAIVSLVLGIISIPCCSFILLGIGAAVTGFIAKKKADENPNEYGGRSFALAGMIIGGITTVLGLIIFILQIFFGVLGNLGNF